MVLAVLVAVLVVAAAILVPLLLTRDDDEGSGGDAGRAAEETVDTSNLDAVEEYDGLSVDHVPEGTVVDYPQSPPVGGDHAQAWLECGVYDEPVPLENVVHSLEHGTVWLTYREDRVDAEGVARLTALVPGNGIVSPHAEQEAPVVVTVWGRQLELTGPDDPRIGLFVAEYGAGDTAPEPFASCHGGVTPDEVDEVDRVDGDRVSALSPGGRPQPRS